MKTFILHLERAPDRKKHMLREVEKHHLDYEIFKAFDCLGLTDDDLSEFCDMETVKKYPDWLTPGMVCASYSHYLIYQQIIKQDLNCALITEDDVSFSDEILQILDEVEKNIAVNEVVLLHYMSFSTLELKKESSIKITPDFSLYEGKTKFPNANSAAGYVITREAAKTLSNLVLPIGNGTDSWMDFGEKGGIEKVRLVYPMPIKTVGFKSKATAGKNKLWNDLTGFIDTHKIPLLFQIFRSMRLKSIENRSKVVIS